MAGIDIRLQIDGVDDVMHRLSRALATETRMAPMQRLKDRLIKRLSTYPPPPPDSTYIRTGELGRGWADEGVSVDAIGTNQFADQVSVTMRNPVEYAPFVQGDPGLGDPHQAFMHVGRWETDQQALDAETGPFLRDLEDSIGSALGGP